MSDFLFADWPNGVGPMIVQATMGIVGAALGIKLLDDAKRAMAAIRDRRARRTI